MFTANTYLWSYDTSICTMVNMAKYFYILPGFE